MLNFIAYYLDTPDAGSDSDSLPRPAPDVPRELGLLDNVASIDPGSAIPTERTYRGRLIVGIGHSLGGSATVFAATACPALFSSLVLVDPVLSPPTMFDPSKTALVAMGALRRRGVWNSRKEAKESFLAKPFFRAWDPRILDGYVDLGMHELGTGQVALKTKPFYEAVSSFLPCPCKNPSREKKELMQRPPPKTDHLSRFAVRHVPPLDPATARPHASSPAALHLCRHGSVHAPGRSDLVPPRARDATCDVDARPGGGSLGQPRATYRDGTPPCRVPRKDVPQERRWWQRIADKGCSKVVALSLSVCIAI